MTALATDAKTNAADRPALIIWIILESVLVEATRLKRNEI
jgi:hypothetical protein